MLFLKISEQFLSEKKIAILIIILIIGGIFFTPVISVLAISSRKNPVQRVYSVDGYKNGFIISYTHSVNKGRVKDFYTVNDNRELLCDATIFVSYGAGIPEPQDFPNAVFENTKDGYKITNINRISKTLTAAVGIIANHAITILKSSDSNSDFTEYFFTDFFEPQTSVILQIKRVSFIDYIFHKID